MVLVLCNKQAYRSVNSRYICCIARLHVCSVDLTCKKKGLLRNLGVMNFFNINFLAASALLCGKNNECHWHVLLTFISYKIYWRKVDNLCVWKYSLWLLILGLYVSKGFLINSGLWRESRQSGLCNIWSKRSQLVSFVAKKGMKGVHLGTRECYLVSMN